jgi:hypothetical protein
VPDRIRRRISSASAAVHKRLSGPDFAEEQDNGLPRRSKFKVGNVSLESGSRGRGWGRYRGRGVWSWGWSRVRVSRGGRIGFRVVGSKNAESRENASQPSVVLMCADWRQCFGRV